MKFETLLPIFAPAPAGLVIAIRLYQEILAAVGVNDVFWQGIAAVGATVGMVGMIGAEMYAYKQAGIAIAERQVGAAVVAFVAAVVCSTLIIWAIGTGANTRPLIVAVIIAIAAYVVLAVRDFMARKKAIKQDQAARVDAQNGQVLELEKQKTKQANAAARLAKAQGGAAVVRPVSIEHTEQVLDEKTLSHARIFFTANPKASARAWLKSDGCPVKSPETASKYRKAVLNG